MSTSDQAEFQTLEVRWESNPYNQPALVNQFISTEGPLSGNHSDGMIYLMMGHLTPPLGDLGVDGPSTELLVTNPINVAFTAARAKELILVLQQTVNELESRNQNSTGENQDVE